MRPQVHSEPVKSFDTGSDILGYNSLWDLPPDKATGTVAKHQFGRQAKAETLLGETSELRTKLPTGRITTKDVSSCQAAKVAISNMMYVP